MLSDIVTLEFKTPVRSNLEIFLYCKWVHTSRDKYVVEIVTSLTEDWYKG